MSAVERLRVPPHALEAEQSVLGGLMLDGAKLDQVADRLVEDDFYRADHRLIFRAINRLAAQQTPFDVITLGEQLTRRGQLDDAGGYSYLATLARDTPSAANVGHYADLVADAAVRRALVTAGADIQTLAYDPDGRPTAALLDDAEKRIFSIADRRNRTGGLREISHWLTATLERIDKLAESDNPITGVPTGWPDLDNLTAGLQPGELAIVAARPSMGKTAFALNLAEYAALKSGVSVGIFSLEMPAEQLMMRMLASLGRIDALSIRTGRLDERQWGALSGALGKLRDAPIWIDDSSALTPTQLHARCRRQQRESGLGLVIVDYLQLMQAPGAESRQTEIAEISRALKALAKDLRAPVVALSQLNRNLEQRTSKRPTLGDLRESGAIEADADTILFLYRDEVYNPNSDAAGVAEIIIGKQRNGPIGTVRLAFLGTHTRFESILNG